MPNPEMPNPEMPSGEAPDRQTGRRRPVRVGWRTLVLWALAVILVLEGAGRVVASQSSFNEDLLPRLLNEHRRNVEARHAAGVDTEILFFGSSTTGAAFDPDLVSADRAYNLWLPAGGAAAIAEFGEAFGTALFDPEVVVVGITSRELNDSRAADNAEVLADVERTLAWRRVARLDLLTRAEMVASEVSVLVRHRAYLRRPAAWVSWLVVEQTPEGLTMDETGKLTRYRARDEPLITAEDEARELQALADFEAGGEQTEGLARLLGLFEGRRVVLVFLPVSEEDYGPLHPGGMADVDRARQVAADTAAATGVEYLDLSSLGEDRTLFGDANHLNQRGSETLTQIVLDHLAVD